MFRTESVCAGYNEGMGEKRTEPRESKIRQERKNYVLFHVRKTLKNLIIPLSIKHFNQLEEEKLVFDFIREEKVLLKALLQR